MRVTIYYPEKEGKKLNPKHYIIYTNFYNVKTFIRKHIFVVIIIKRVLCKETISFSIALFFEKKNKGKRII